MDTKKAQFRVGHLTGYPSDSNAVLIWHCKDGDNIWNDKGIMLIFAAK